VKLTTVGQDRRIAFNQSVLIAKSRFYGRLCWHRINQQSGDRL